MLVPGHLATGMLAGVVAARLSGRRPSVRWMLVPAALGGISPDLLDKTRMALGGSIYGRTVGHSTLFLVGIALAWALWWAWSARSAGFAQSAPSAPSAHSIQTARPAQSGRSARSTQSDRSVPVATAAPLAAAAPPTRHPDRRAQASATLHTAFGFWVLGVATHSVADLADDALRGLTQGGLVASSWFAWPWATPYTHVLRVPDAVLTIETLGPLGAWLQGWSAPIAPVEAAVLLLAVGWVGVRGLDALRRRERCPGTRRPG